jgi:TM2 domain-containing membrane protein YozV
MVAHRNKTFVTLIAFVLGGLGMHRFYLYGWKDRWAWAHFCALPLSALLFLFFKDQLGIFAAGPLVLSVLAAFIETLVIGLTPDDKWDALHNRGSGMRSQSGWPIAVLLVLTVGVGATALIAVIARSIDLALTGGAYG